MTPPKIRPSSLPKLALCPRYASDPTPSEAASRGTNLDALIRASLQSGEISPDVVKSLDKADMLAVVWTLQTAGQLAFSAPIESREEKLKVEWNGISGTMDLLCRREGWGADIKTGQMRDYEAQMALYALGCMDSEFSDEWKMHILYSDEQQVCTYYFTRERAEKLVNSIVASVKEQAPPQANEYCGWCANRWTCDARREQLAVVPLADTVELAKEQMATWTPEKLRDFVLACDAVADFRDEARAQLFERAKLQKVEGVSVVSKRGKDILPAEKVVELCDQLDKAEAARQLGAVSAEKAALLFPSAPIADLITTTPGTSYVTVRRPKLTTKPQNQ
jgi:hypothetical protein